LVDAKIKGRLAAAMSADTTSPYSPLYVRAAGMPRPWGVTALFSEYTGTHRALDIDWSLERGVHTEPPALVQSTPPKKVARDVQAKPAANRSEPAPVESPRSGAFATFWEFAIALNRSEPAA